MRHSKSIICLYYFLCTFVLILMFVDLQLLYDYWNFSTKKILIHFYMNSIISNVICVHEPSFQLECFPFIIMVYWERLSDFLIIDVFSILQFLELKLSSHFASCQKTSCISWTAETKEIFWEIRFLDEYWSSYISSKRVSMTYGRWRDRVKGGSH